MDNNFIPDRQKDKFWSKAWKRHIETYLSVPPRTGFWIKSNFPGNFSVLEIAGGSCRDSRYLANNGYHAIGSDFDQVTIDYLRSRFPESRLPLQKEDAFRLSFSDNSFDITFSNGFWILFDDNKDITALIKEQARVTSKYMISLIHNGENHRLIETFKQKATKDPLYKIRFFNRSEISGLFKESGIHYKSLKIKKFGGPADRFYSKKIKKLIPLSEKTITSLYKFQPWSKVERLAVIAELD